MPQQVRGVCINAWPLWKGPRTIFSGFCPAQCATFAEMPPDGGPEPGEAVTDLFDFIVVGGGSGGCAVAGRLSEDKHTSVALLEAGGRNDTWVVTTRGALVLMVAGKVNNWAL